MPKTGIYDYPQVWISESCCLNARLRNVLLLVLLHSSLWASLWKEDLSRIEDLAIVSSIASQQIPAKGYQTNQMDVTKDIATLFDSRVSTSKYFSD